MAIVHDQGIVLRSYPFGEADRVLHLYSSNRGRIGAMFGVDYKNSAYARNPAIARKLVELFVHRPEGVSDHGPVQLLADQRQIDELVQRRLQLLARSFPFVVHRERRQIGRCCR